MMVEREGAFSTLISYRHLERVIDARARFAGRIPTMETEKTVMNELSLSVRSGRLMAEDGRRHE
jgi:hypothetical protein